jgi:uncharacterized pyridoxamine 5'-phosphate oxidase family protein
MTLIHTFHQIMAKQSEIALATCVGESPNVRIVNFYYNPVNSGVLYFATFKNNQKVNEFSQNSHVAFTTVPVNAIEHVRTNSGRVYPSQFAMKDVAAEFIKKIPSYADIITLAGDQLALYEIHFNTATVTLNENETGKIDL